MAQAIDLYRFIDAYEAYDGGDLGELIHAWSTGDICQETPTGLHQVSEGSCDMCGSKNFA